jgi:AraC-like DNA-binding protein
VPAMTASRQGLIERPDLWTDGQSARTLSVMNRNLTTVDPLGEALHFLRMDRTVYAHCELSAPWAIRLPPMDRMLMFHVVLDGLCWLEIEGSEPVLLRTGDLVLMPHGDGHVIASRAGEPPCNLFDIPRKEQGERYEVIAFGGGGAGASLICGAVEYDNPATSHLISLLPRYIRIDASRPEYSGWIGSTLQVMAMEARERRPGSETVVARMTDILLIQAIRGWIEREPGAQSGWIGAIQDRQIGQAMSLIHRNPARSWTVAELAAEVAMSRSAFSARFSDLVGEPPITYLTRWRIHLAGIELQDADTTLGEVAARSGYGSEAAFNRAFKRITGKSPGRWRSRSRTSAFVTSGERLTN